MELDNETWRWLWTITSITFGLAEIITTGFFLLPFAIGAAVAAVLAWIDSPILWQWSAFFIATCGSFMYLRKFVRRQNNADQLKVGANRLIGSEGIVIEQINEVTGAGMVRIRGEQWRALSDRLIEPNAKVTIVEIRGTRLFVEPLTNN